MNTQEIYDAALIAISKNYNVCGSISKLAVCIRELSADGKRGEAVLAASFAEDLISKNTYGQPVRKIHNGRDGHSIWRLSPERWAEYLVHATQLSPYFNVPNGKEGNALAYAQAVFHRNRPLASQWVGEDDISQCFAVNEELVA